MSRIVETVKPGKAYVVESATGIYGVTVFTGDEGYYDAPFVGPGVLANVYSESLQYPLFDLEAAGGPGVTLDEVLSALDNPDEVTLFTEDEIVSAEEATYFKLLMGDF